MQSRPVGVPLARHSRWSGDLSIAMSWSKISRPTSVAAPMGFGFDRCCAARVIVHRVGGVPLGSFGGLSIAISWYMRAGTHHVLPESQMMHSRGRPSADSQSQCRWVFRASALLTLVSSSTGWESVSALSVVCLSLSPGLSWAGTHRVLPESRSHSRGRPSAEDSRSADGFWTLPALV